MKVITHLRETFYNGKPIYWYEFTTAGGSITLDSMLGSFLRVPTTKYYEYGGTYEDAIKTLTTAGVIDIIEGKEI